MSAPLPEPSIESFFGQVARLGSDWPPIFRHAVTLAQGTDDEGKAHWLRAWPAVVEEATGLLETASPGHAEPPSEQMHRVLCAVFAAFDASLGSRVPDALAQPGASGIESLRSRLRDTWVAHAAAELARNPLAPAIDAWGAAGVVGGGQVAAVASCRVQLLVEAQGAATALRAVLQLRLVDAPGAELALVPAPASALLFCAPDFLAVLGEVSRFLRTKVQGSPGGRSFSRDTALQWDIFTPRKQLLGISGPSAGAAFAVAGLWLLQDRLPPGEIKTALARLPYWALQGAGISIGIDAQGRLSSIGAAVRKAQAYVDVRQDGERLNLFMHPHNADEVRAADLHGLAVHGAETLRELVDGLARSGDLPVALARLHDVLPMRSLPEDDDRLPPPSEGELRRQRVLFDSAWEARREARDLRAYMLVRWARWAREEGGELHMRFVPLSLVASEGAERLDPGLSQVPLKGLAELLRSVHSREHGRDTVGALLLRGSAGAGKSTAMQRYEQTLCLDFLRHQHAAGGGSDADAIEVPLYVRLASLPAEEKDPVKWLRQQVQTLYPRCQPLHDLLHGRQPAGAPRARLRLLLDGLNELAEPPDQGRVQRAEDVVCKLRDAFGLELAPLLSSRGHHGFELMPSVQRGACVQVQPWSDDLVLAYVRKCFSVLNASGYIDLRPEGQALIDALQATRARGVLALCSTPFNAAGQVRLWAGGRHKLVSDRADLYRRLLREALVRELALDKDTGKPLNPLFYDPELLTADDRRVLVDEAAWSEEPAPDWPVQGALLRTLFKQALDQWLASDRPPSERGTVEVPWDDQEDPRRSVASELGPDLRRRWRQAVRALGLMADDPDGSGKRFAFRHQSWGEYLASVVLLTPAPDEMPEEDRQQLLQRLQQGRAFECSAEEALERQRRQADELWMLPGEAWWKALLDEPLQLRLGDVKAHLLRSGWPESSLNAPDNVRKSKVLRAKVSRFWVQRAKVPTAKVSPVEVPRSTRSLWQDLQSRKAIEPYPEADLLTVHLRAWGDQLALARRWGNRRLPWAQQPRCLRAFVLWELWTPVCDAVWARLRDALGEQRVQDLRRAKGRLTPRPVGSLDEILGLALLGLLNPVPWLRWLIERDLWPALEPILADLKTRLEGGAMHDRSAAAVQLAPDPTLQVLRSTLLLRSLDAGPASRPAVERSGQLMLLPRRDAHCDPVLRAHWHADLDIAFTEGHDLRERLQAGRMLGVLGDGLRYEPARALSGWGLRLKAGLWAGVGIPGTVTRHLIGSEKSVRSARRNERRDDHPAFWTDPPLRYFELAKLPVTCAEWAAFVEADGYDPNALHWQRAGLAALAWIRRKGLTGSESRKRRWPRALADPERGNGLNPITTVNVFEAMAYAHWCTPMHDGDPAPAGLAGQGGAWQVRLPSEVEWEAAMRVEAGGQPPPSDGPRGPVPGVMDYNCAATGLGQPSPVGVFSRGYSPAGLADGLGNVWEWCCNALPDGPQPYDRTGQQAQACEPWDGADDRSPRARRGGAYSSAPKLCWAAYRNHNSPEYGGTGNGVRLLRVWLPHSEV